MILKVPKWLARNCITEVDVIVAQGLCIHCLTVKHSAEKLQAASVDVIDCSRNSSILEGSGTFMEHTRTQSQTGLACLAGLLDNRLAPSNLQRCCAGWA